MKKRFAAIFLAAALAVTAAPYGSFAAEANSDTPAEQVEEAVEAVQEEIEEAEGAAQEAAGEIADAIGEAEEEIANTAEDIASQITDAAQEAGSEIADAANQAGSEIADAANQAADQAAGALEDAGAAIEEAVDAAPEGEGSTLSSVLMAQFDDQIDELKASMEEAKAQAAEAPAFTADLSLTLEDSVKGMLGMVIPFDISWLSGIDFRLDLSLKDKVVNAVLSGSVNETPVVSIKALVDPEADAIYLQSPELSDSCLSASLSELAESLSQQADAQVSSSSLSEEQTEMIKLLVTNIMAYEYDTDTVAAIYRDIMEIVLSAYQDQGSEEEALTAGGITQPATKYIADITLDSSLNYVKDLMVYIRDSEPIAKYFETIVEGTNLGLTFGDVQTMIDDALGELNSEELDIGDQTIAQVCLWADENDKPIGVATNQQMEIEDVSMSSSMLFAQTQEDDKYGFLMNVGDAENVYVNIEGTGQAAQGLLSGEYGVNVLGYDVASITVTDYDLAAEEKGYPNGTYKLNFSIPEDLDPNQQLGILNNFGLLASIASDKSGFDCKLTVNSADVPLVTLGFAGAGIDTIDGIDPAAAASIIDITDSEAFEGFLSELNPMGLFEKLQEAGMPEDFLDSIMSMLS